MEEIEMGSKNFPFTSERRKSEIPAFLRIAVIISIQRNVVLSSSSTSEKNLILDTSFLGMYRMEVQVPNDGRHYTDTDKSEKKFKLFLAI
ncbi:hypothetical protein AVEN_50720-1 [Araneus ventricosus]|uniref:Uncharacterized protein n=1 Tax=Araneus ventricosus TaxID=182803 RepID=A0A4Y2HYK1_ARAVE|nr:hypothetical protein AVEN_50720-1 [Araneus ventricosus]